VIAIPATPALAAREIDLDPDEGEIGEYFYVEGDGFPATTSTILREVDIYFSSEEADTADDIDDEVTIYERLKSGVAVDEYGEFRRRVRVPTRLTDGDEDEYVLGGTYYVYVTYAGADDIRAVAEFTVIHAAIELDTEEGPVGTEVEITGADFDDSEEITVEYDGEDITDEIVSGEAETDRYGEFDCTIIISDSTAGDHTIAVEDESEHRAEALFTVEPEIIISPTSGAAGNEVTVSGTGFGDERDVTITFGGDEVSTTPSSVETGSDGSFEAAFDVPISQPGTCDIEAEDADDNTATAEFTIAASVSISPVTSQTSAGHVGMDITISGTGFEANHEIIITYATEPIVVATTASDANGAFSATFKVPQSEAGEHIITASDGINTKQVTFTMESIPPPIPVPLLPETGVEAESPVHFDWEDVTDESLPVTYTLQIATDEDFTPASIVLEKDLTDSEYTITEEEKLEPRKEETPYYWRVKAIDGASNGSEWSAPGSFYIGGRLSLPSWSTHLWWGLGALGAGFLGYWLGKRRAYYLS